MSSYFMDLQSQIQYSNEEEKIQLTTNNPFYFSIGSHINQRERRKNKPSVSNSMALKEAPSSVSNFLTLTQNGQ